MKKEEAILKIKELTSKINYHNHLYYQLNTIEISDKEFDLLLQELISLENQFPMYRQPQSPTQRVGGSITKNFETVTHKKPMLSLGNTYSEEDLLEFDERIKKILEEETYEYVCELKFDGVALSCTYENGILKTGATRGDGKQGDNITTNVKTIKTIPLQIFNDALQNFEVRGEVFFPIQEFERTNREKEDLGEAPLANPRNACSGTIKMQDSKVVASRKLDCYIYSLDADEIQANSHFEALELLQKSGFNVSPTYEKCKSIQDVFAYIEKWKEKRFELPLDTDGIVIKINSFRQQKELGFTSKSPRWAIAFKYETESATTLLEKITYQVGRTGAITPVANLTPVLLAGTMVKRASLHNANEIERLDVREGDIVHVEKGGEIIPKVTKVALDQRPQNSVPTAYITNCPECHTPLVRAENEAQHYCPNIKICPPQVKGRIEHFIQRKAMNIEGLGPETIDQLFEEKLIQDPMDLYKLTFDQLINLERFAQKSAENLVKNIQKSKEIPFEKVLFAIGIRFVGSTVAEKLAQQFSSFENLSKASIEQLVETPEIGERIAQSVRSFFHSEDNLDFINKIYDVNLQLSLKEDKNISLSNTLDGKSFVISGVFSEFSRDELKENVKSHGGKVISAISGKLDYLLAGEKMGPSKLEKAEKLGIKIISEQEYLAMVNP